MRSFVTFLMLSSIAVAGEHKQEISVTNNVKVINNLVVPAKLKPLVIERPPATPAPLTMRPFSFNPNMGPLPQKGDDYKSPFVGALPDVIPNPIILNNIATRKSSTTVTYESKGK